MLLGACGTTPESGRAGTTLAARVAVDAPAVAEIHEEGGRPIGNAVVVPDRTREPGGWAFVAFHRSPSCLPPTATVIGRGSDQATDCAVLVARRAGASGDEGAAARLTLVGEDIPVWFLSSEVLDTAAAGSDLTSAEFQRLPTLVRGVAHSYREVREGDRLVLVEAEGVTAAEEAFNISVEAFSPTAGAEIDVPWEDLDPPPASDRLRRRWASSRAEFDLSSPGEFALFPTTSGGVSETPLDIGTYSIVGRILSIHSGPQAMCPGRSGSYLATELEDGSVRLQKIRDDCPGRPRLIEAVWKQSGSNSR